MSGMRNSGFLMRLLRKEAYWRWRQRSKKTAFLGRRIAHWIADATHSQKTSISIHVGLLRLLAWKVVAFATVAGLVLFLDWKVVPQYSDFNSEASTALISLLAQVFGVLLGLYFATLGVVVSTAYSQVPQVVRRLFIEEEVNNVYLTQIVGVTLFCVFLLAGASAGIRPGILSLVLVTLAGATGICSVGILGKRIFVFLDTRQLIEYPKRDFIRSARSATPDGIFWDDVSFQGHHERRAEIGLEAIEGISRLVISGRRSEELAIESVARQVLDLFSVYCSIKSRIPSDSRWFRREIQHPNWLLASEIEVIMALNTGIGLQPKEAPDHLWVERRLIRIVQDCLEALMKERNPRGVNLIFFQIQMTAGRVAQSYCIEESSMLMDLARTIALRVDHKSFVAAESIETGGDKAYRVAIHDSYHSEVTATLIGIVLRVRDLSSKSVETEVRETQWNRKGSIYREVHPVQVRRQYEFLWSRIGFEEVVESEIVSPDWYKAQLVGIGYPEWLDQSLEIVLKQYETRVELVSQHVRNSDYLSAAAGIQRGLETYEKLKQHMAIMGKWSEDFSSLSRIGDIPWPKIRWDEWRDKAELCRRTLIHQLGDVAKALAESPRDEKIPDYLGFAYTWLENECYQSMAEADEAEFTALFPSYFAAAITMQEKVRQELTGQAIESVVVFAGEPLENLLVLSGYALLYSDIQGKSYWSIARSTWDSYLAGSGSPKKVVEFIHAVCEYRRGVFGVKPRASIRANWQSHFERVLRGLGLVDEWHGYSRGDANRKSDRIGSLVESLARGRYWHYDARDVFIGVYLSGIEGLDKLEWGWAVASIRKVIDRIEPEGHTTHA